MSDLDTLTDEHLEALLAFLKNERAFDFTGYKRASLTRRIQRRMQDINIQGYDNYLDYLQVHPDEFIPLFNTILINVTSFFRDPDTWDYIRDSVLPSILALKGDDGQIRVWSAGCATGEEAYSMAMLLAEAMGMDAYRQRVKIYATDVDEDALTRARLAVFTGKRLEPVPATLRTRYFPHAGADQYTLHNDLRRSVIFGRHDLVRDAPMSRIDLLLCRNTLMYFNADTQQRAITRMHFALTDHGCLVLGKAEMLLNRNEMFEAVDMKQRVFRKSGMANTQERLLALMQTRGDNGKRVARMPPYLQEAAFNAAVVAEIVVDAQGRLALVNTAARELFGLVSNDVGRPFRDVELSYRPVELRSRIEDSYKERQPQRLRDIKRALPDGTIQYLEVTIIPLFTQDAAQGVSINFVEVTQAVELRYQLNRVHHELETAYEELQSTNEELETTNEELQSTVEELETTNEELQSSNEELETMNEELQSTNEQLRATNDTLNVQAVKLDHLNIHLNGILGSLDSAVIVVDTQLHILYWNRTAEDMWGLRTDEVRDQPLSDLDIGLPINQVEPFVRTAMSGSQDNNLLTVDAINRRGRAFRCRLRVTALLDPTDTVIGAVLLMHEEERKP
jgi:two-component system, chemotaxis family, CheB/CheR fusion protein